MKKFAKIGEYNKEFHLKYAPNEHWYLQTLGVEPSFQGKGYGSFLMNFMLEKIDKQGIPVYLETLNKINVKFYKKFGFEVMEKVIIPGTNVKEWLMIREI